MMRARRVQKKRHMMAERSFDALLTQHTRWLLFLDYWEALPLFARKLSFKATRVRAFVKSAANDPLALRANLSDAGQHKMDDLPSRVGAPQ